MAGKKKIIGIDLGTTNSVVAIYEGGEPTVITNAQGSRLTPSVVGFQDDSTRLVGQLAKRQAVQNPRNTVYSIKRFMGRRHNEVQNEEKMVPYGITGGADELVKVRIGDKDYTPPEISAMILQDLKATAENYLGEKVTEAVITVPAYFNDAQRQATKDAGAIAGLEVKRIVNEPTAAALAFGLDKKKDQVIAVFDLGGGTFDVSILEQSEVDGESVFEVKATNGDTHLGGDDFDEALINWIADEFKKEHGVDLRKDQMALQRLKEAAEKAKCELSTTPSTTINLPFITQDAQRNAVHLNMNISRSKFEQLCEPIFNKVIDPCRKCMEDAKISAKQIDEVLLVGGSTRIPKIQSMCEEIFGRKANRSVNPDEVVALGAAVQAHILADPEAAGITFLDVTPLSLGVEVEHGLFAILIDRNTTIPVQKKETFSTAADSQPAVDIQVYQGERKMAKDNRLLGHFRLDGIPPAPRGMPQIEVAFDIDANGILNVTAKDLGTGKEHHITIESSSGLSEAEVERMKKDAEAHAAEDEKRKAEAELLNQAETMEYAARKAVKEYGDKMSATEKAAIEKEADNLRKAIDGGDTDKIRSAKEALEKAQMAASESIYKAVAAQQQAAGGAGVGPMPGVSPDMGGSDAGSGGDGEVIDAEYTVKDDDKK
ncbi:MAG: molecular chaperone DnaK [Planctomycetota bacterium]